MADVGMDLIGWYFHNTHLRYNILLQDNGIEFTSHKDRMSFVSFIIKSIELKKKWHGPKIYYK